MDHQPDSCFYCEHGDPHPADVNRDRIKLLVAKVEHGHLDPEEFHPALLDIQLHS